VAIKKKTLKFGGALENLRVKVPQGRRSDYKVLI